MYTFVFRGVYKVTFPRVTRVLLFLPPTTTFLTFLSWHSRCLIAETVVKEK